jgi:hypothetical protein
VISSDVTVNVSLGMEGIFLPQAMRNRESKPLDHILVGGILDATCLPDCTRLGQAVCLTHLASHRANWSAPAGYDLAAAPGGGFLLTSQQPDAPKYWVPLAPRQVELDQHGRLLRVEPARLSELKFSNGELQVSFADSELLTETVVWQMPPGFAPQPVSSLERGAWYTLGSHTAIHGRVDVYKHLVAGTVFEDRPAWPNKWHVFSENDGHALHLILGGLAKAANDPLLDAMRRQVLLAVLDRQSEDGGFRHGEWTSLMEAHCRLHCSAMHVMMDALDEQHDPGIERALRAAAAFMARQTARLSFGQWLLHDDLEHSVDRIRQAPLSWLPSEAFGKAQSNMLVLNSHLDATIALDRYAQLTGDQQFSELVLSARESTKAVLGLRSAERLYQVLFWLIGLTFVPTKLATALPAWKRALKRLTWQYLIPRLPAIKVRFPRLVMPGGYIDRDLTQCHWALDYHAVNLMDLARYLRRFDEPIVRQVLVQGLEFTRQSGILQRWQELGYRKYALGFWAEALYHVCTLMPDLRYRQWLAEAMLQLEALKMGQPPSLLGTNAEAVPAAQQLPCPSPVDARLRVANLGRRGAAELLVVNPTESVLSLVWEIAPQEPYTFFNADGSPLGRAALHVPAGGWLWACAAH